MHAYTHHCKPPPRYGSPDHATQTQHRERPCVDVPANSQVRSQPTSRQKVRTLADDSSSPSYWIFSVKAPDIMGQRSAIVVLSCRSYWSTESKSIILFRISKLWGGFLYSNKDWNSTPSGICLDPERNPKEVEGLWRPITCCSAHFGEAQNPQGAEESWHSALTPGKGQGSFFPWAMCSFILEAPREGFPRSLLGLGLTLGCSLKGSARGFWKSQIPLALPPKCVQNLSTFYHVHLPPCSNLSSCFWIAAVGS